MSLNKQEKESTDQSLLALIRTFPHYDKLAAFLASLMVGIGVGEKISSEEKRSEAIREQIVAHINERVVVIEKDKKQDQEEEDEDKKELEKVLPRPVLEPDADKIIADSVYTPDIPPPPPVSAEAKKQIEAYREQLKADLIENPEMEVSYIDMVLELAAITFELDAEKVHKLYSRFMERNRSLRRFLPDINRFAFEARALQGRYKPNNRSVMQILLGNDFDQEDPAGNCMARAENVALQLATVLPEEQIFFQYFNQSTDSQGRLTNVGHIRTVYKLGNQYYSMEGNGGPTKLDVKTPGTLIVPMREAMKEFVGLGSAANGRAKPEVYVPYDREKEKKLSERREGEFEPSGHEIFAINHGIYSLRPFAGGDIVEQKTQPKKPIYRGVNEKEENPFNYDNKALKENAKIVPPDLDVNDSVKVHGEIIELWEKIKQETDKEKRDEMIVELYVKRILANLNHKKMWARGDDLFTGFSDSKQLLNLDDKLSLRKSRRSAQGELIKLKTEVIYINDRQQLMIMNHPSVLKAIRFARENDVQIQELKIVKGLNEDEQKAIMARLKGCEINAFRMYGAKKDIFEGEEYNNLNLKFVYFTNPEVGFSIGDQLPGKDKISILLEAPEQLPHFFNGPEDQHHHGEQLKYYDHEKDEVVATANALDAANVIVDRYIEKINRRKEMNHTRAYRISFNEGESNDVSYYGEQFQKLVEDTFIRRLEEIKSVRSISSSFTLKGHDPMEEKIWQMLKIIRVSQRKIARNVENITIKAKYAKEIEPDAVNWDELNRIKDYNVLQEILTKHVLTLDLSDDDETLYRILEEFLEKSREGVDGGAQLIVNLSVHETEESSLIAVHRSDPSKRTIGPREREEEIRFED